MALLSFKSNKQQHKYYILRMAKVFEQDGEKFIVSDEVLDLDLTKLVEQKPQQTDVGTTTTFNVSHNLQNIIEELNKLTEKNEQDRKDVSFVFVDNTISAKMSKFSCKDDVYTYTIILQNSEAVEIMTLLQQPKTKQIKQIVLEENIITFEQPMLILGAKIKKQNLLSWQCQMILKAI